MRDREVTRKEVDDAALIGQISAEADLARAGTICRGSCGHLIEEHCVADALGVSPAAVAVDLWLAISNAVATPLSERTKEVRAAKTSAEKRRIKQLYAWVDDVVGSVEDFATAELHAAALLHDGELPPGWKIRKG
jgi:hypothetical protein